MKWWSKWPMIAMMLAVDLTGTELSRVLSNTPRLAAIRSFISYTPFSNRITLAQSTAIMLKSQKRMARIISVTPTNITTDRNMRLLRHQRSKRCKCCIKRTSIWIRWLVSCTEKISRDIEMMLSIKLWDRNRRVRTCKPNATSGN